jgi:hypothetical protein
MPAQLMFGNSDVNSRGSGLPWVALRTFAVQASIVRLSAKPLPAPSSRKSTGDAPCLKMN